MTKRAELRELLQVSDVQYNRQRQALAKLIEEENALRAELTRLAQMDRVSELGTDANLRAVGADLLWKGWLSRAKTNVNMQLARVLAAKAHEQSKVRRAFGKVTALGQILIEEEAKHRKNLAKDALEKAITSSLHRQT